MYELPNKGRCKILFSGGDKHRSKKIINSIVNYKAVSERHITLKISGRIRNLLVHQIYARNMTWRHSMEGMRKKF